MATANVITRNRPTLIDRMREILPEIKANAREAEQIRQVPKRNMELLREIGYMRALVPVGYGGLQAPLGEALRAGRLLGSACMSTAWVATLFIIHSHANRFFDKRVQDEIWGELGPDAFIGSSISAAKASSRKVPGGHVISGHYPFSSGCDHSQWALLGHRVINEKTGQLDRYMSAVPRKDYTIDDTWFTVGLRGTGSKDVVVDEVFVPEYRTMGPGIRGLSGYCFPAPMLGAADSIIALYRERLESRTRAHTGHKYLETPYTFYRLAESVADVNAAGLVLEHDWDAADPVVRAGEEPSPEQRAFWMTNGSYAGRVALRAADRLIDASGGSMFFQDQELQRYWRDMHQAAGHVFFDFDTALDKLGRFLVGLPPDSVYI